LAVRNHPRLKLDDFTNLLDALQGQGRRKSRYGGGSGGGGGKGGGGDDGGRDGSGDTDSEGGGDKGGLGAPSSMPLLLTPVSKDAVSGIKWLDLSGNRLGDAGAAQVINAVARCPSIVHLDLSANAIGRGGQLRAALLPPEGFMAVGGSSTSGAGGGKNGERKGRPALAFSMPWSGDCGASADENGGGGGGGGSERSAPAVWLRTLLLDNNALSNTTAAALLAALADDASLVRLGLGQNGLSKPNVGAALRLCLGCNGTLTDLDLHGNALDEKAANEALHGLLGADAPGSALRFLRLRGNGLIEPKTLEMIEEELVANRAAVFQAAYQRRHRARRRPSLTGGTESTSTGGSRPDGGSVSSYGGGGGGGGSGKDKGFSPALNGRAIPAVVAVPAQPGHGSASLLPFAPVLSIDTRNGSGTGTAADMTEVTVVDADGRPLPIARAASASSPGKATAEALEAAIPAGEIAAAAGATDGAPPYTLTVLFAAPLAYQDANMQLRPIVQLDHDLEREMLWSTLRESGRDVGVVYDFATARRLRTAVTLGCRALHYSGHGHQSYLAFETNVGGLHPMRLDQLRDLCAAGSGDQTFPRLEFVFVSACYSRLAAEAFADAGVPHVVCVKLDAQLMDVAARSFTSAFYLALAVGHTVRDAFDIGRQSVSNDPDVPDSAEAEREKFLLLPEGHDHAVAIFPNARPLSDRAGGGGRGGRGKAHLPAPPGDDFCGREVLCYLLIKAVMGRRFVALIGDPGVGKSAVAAAVARYMAERRYFADGVFFVRAQGLLSREEVAAAMVGVLG
ncbi:unnamed protein product, partial [Phaeothamnion confervicola]